MAETTNQWVNQLREFAEKLAQCLTSHTPTKSERQHARALLRRAFSLEERLLGYQDTDEDPSTYVESVLRILRALDRAESRISGTQGDPFLPAIIERYDPTDDAIGQRIHADKVLLWLNDAEALRAPFDRRNEWLMARVEANKPMTAATEIREAKSAPEGVDDREAYELVTRKKRPRRGKP